MKKIKPILITLAIAVTALFIVGRASALSPFMPWQGGTGTTTAPSYGEVLVGNSNGTFSLTATSSLGIISGGGLLTYDAWTHPANNTSATTSLLWAQNGINASSTSHFDYASTTQLEVSDNFKADIWDGDINYLFRLDPDNGMDFYAENTPSAWSNFNVSPAEIYFDTPSLKIGNLSTANGIWAILNTDNLTTSDKTFTFPDASGTLCLSGVNCLSSYDAWTHPAIGQSATTSLMVLSGQASTTQLSVSDLLFANTLNGEYLTINSDGTLHINATDEASIDISAVGGRAFITSDNYVELRSDDPGYIYLNSAQIYTATNAKLGLGTTTPQWQIQIASSTKSQLTLSDGSATSNHWSFRNAGGNFYLATSSPSTFATTSTAALEIQNQATTTLRNTKGFDFNATGHGMRVIPGATTTLEFY